MQSYYFFFISHVRILKGNNFYIDWMRNISINLAGSDDNTEVEIRSQIFRKSWRFWPKVGEYYSISKALVR